jgi:hypothetical protein
MVPLIQQSPFYSSLVQGLRHSSEFFQKFWKFAAGMTTVFPITLWGDVLFSEFKESKSF